MSNGSDTTYTISIAGKVITLTPSTGTAQTITLPDDLDTGFGAVGADEDKELRFIAQELTPSGKQDFSVTLASTGSSSERRYSFMKGAGTGSIASSTDPDGIVRSVTYIGSGATAFPRAERRKFRFQFEEPARKNRSLAGAKLVVNGTEHDLEDWGISSDRRYREVRTSDAVSYRYRSGSAVTFNLKFADGTYLGYTSETKTTRTLLKEDMKGTLGITDVRENVTSVLQDATDTVVSTSGEATVTVSVPFDFHTVYDDAGMSPVYDAAAKRISFEGLSSSERTSVVVRSNVRLRHNGGECSVELSLREFRGSAETNRWVLARRNLEEHGTLFAFDLAGESVEAEVSGGRYYRFDIDVKRSGDENATAGAHGTSAHVINFASFERVEGDRRWSPRETLAWPPNQASSVRLTYGDRGSGLKTTGYFFDDDEVESEVMFSREWRGVIGEAAARVKFNVTYSGKSGNFRSPYDFRIAGSWVLSDGTVSDWEEKVEVSTTASSGSQSLTFTPPSTATGMHLRYMRETNTFTGSSDEITFAAGDPVIRYVSGGGLTQVQVDARVQAGVEDWAQNGNTDQIPANKLNNAPRGTSGLTQAQVDARAKLLAKLRGVGALPASLSAYAAGDAWLVPHDGLYEAVTATGKSATFSIAGLAPTQDGDDYPLPVSTIPGVTEMIADNGDIVVKAAPGTFGRDGLDIVIGNDSYYCSYEQTALGSDEFFATGINGFAWTTSPLVANSYIHSRSTKPFTASALQWSKAFSHGGILKSVAEPFEIDKDGELTWAPTGITGASEIGDDDGFIMQQGTGDQEVYTSGIPFVKQKLGINMVDAGNVFPATVHESLRFRLLREQSVFESDKSVAVVADGGANAGRNSILIDPTHSITIYPATYSGSDAAAYRGKAFLLPSELSRAPGRKVRIDGVEHVCDDATTGSLNLEYRIQGVTAADFAVGTKYAVNAQKAGGTWIYPATVYEPGDYTYRGGDAPRWSYTPGLAAPWASQGQPEPRTLLAVTKLNTGAGVGLTINRSGANARLGAPVAFNTAFDLDDDDKQVGTVEVSASFQLVNRGTTDIGLNSGASAANAVDKGTIQGFRFATELRDSPDFSSTENGLRVGTASVFKGAVLLGVLEFYLAHDAANALGYHFRWEGASGTSSFSVSVTELDAAFVHNDGGTRTGRKTILDDLPSRRGDLRGGRQREREARDGSERQDMGIHDSRRGSGEEVGEDGGGYGLPV